MKVETDKPKLHISYHMTNANIKLNCTCQLEEKAKLAKLLEEKNNSLEREQRKAKKAMQELVINYGHLAV